MTTDVREIMKYAAKQKVSGNYIKHAEILLNRKFSKSQVRVINSAMKSGACVHIPNEIIGKTSVILPAIGLTYMLQFQGATVVSVSPVLRHAHCQLYPVLECAAKNMGWKSSKTSLSVRSKESNGLPPSEWICVSNNAGARCLEGCASRTLLGEDRNRHYLPLVVLVDCQRLDEWTAMAIRHARPDVLVIT